MISYECFIMLLHFLPSSWSDRFIFMIFGGAICIPLICNYAACINFYITSLEVEKINFNKISFWYVNLFKHFLPCYTILIYFLCYTNIATTKTYFYSSSHLKINSYSKKSYKIAWFFCVVMNRIFLICK